MSLHVFLVQGPERDLFVTARGSVEAVKLWRRYYETEEAPDYCFRIPKPGVRPSAHLWDSLTNEV
jgi:hypothetical protein